MRRSSPTFDTPRDRVLGLMRAHGGMIRPRDLEEIGVPREYLRRLRDEGVLEQPARGLYVLAAPQPTQHQSLVEACKLVPRAVVCLLSALQFHSLTTQQPHEVWIALPAKAWSPKLDSPKLRVTRYSPATFSFGMLEHRVDGAAVRVFTPAKTVADCFKFRSKVGLDVALEALRDCLAQKMATVDEIWQAAHICRVANVIRPYLEALA